MTYQSLNPAGRKLGDMGIQEFVNKKPVRVASMEAPA